MHDPDMLEHANRDDAVEAAIQLPIIEQLERHTILQPLGLCSGPRLGQLLGRQRDAGDQRAVVPCQRQRQPTPAGADVEHRKPRTIETELRRDMPLLGELRLFQRFVAAREVGAGVLPVAIEEQTVEPPVQIIVVRDVAPRAMCGIVLVEAAPKHAERRAHAGDGMAGGARHHVERQHLDHVVEAASIRDPSAIHVGLAQPQHRVDDQAADRPCIVDRETGFRP